MDKNYKIFILLLISMQITKMVGQTSQHSIEPIALDESIRSGQLENGFTYYIKNLPESTDKINLRFYVKAGSNHQDSDQLNMAHFVEHMAFKSSKNFPLGIFNHMDRYEFELNGTAGGHYSLYTINTAQDNQEALKSGMLWFHDIATGLHFKQEEIDKERGVLIQELILRSGGKIQRPITKNKLHVKLFPCKENYANYIDHHETFDPERLKQFYKDWYRPDRMALVIVGNIDDIDALQKIIEDSFSEIKANDYPRDIPQCEDQYFNQPPQFAVVETALDSVQTFPNVTMQFYFRDPDTKYNISEFEGIKRVEGLGLLLDIINNRFKEKSNTYNSFFNAYMRHMFKSSTATPSSFQVILNSEHGYQKEAIQEMFRVLHQLTAYGVLEQEFEEAVRTQLGSISKIRPDQARYWLEEINNHFIYGEALPTNKLEAIQDWLSLYTVEEFQEFIESLSFVMPDDIGILAPSGLEALSFTEEQVRSWIDSIDGETHSAYSMPSAPTNLMTPIETAKLEENYYVDNGVKESGAREVILQNGIKIVMKSFEPSAGPQQEEISIHGFKNKGAHNFPAEDYFSAVNAPLFIKNSGLGDLNKFELEQYLSSTSIFWQGIYPYINNQEVGIKLAANPQDLEELLQLVYLFFTNPRIESEAFQDWKRQRKLYYENMTTNIKGPDLNNKIRKILNDDSQVIRGTTERYLGLEETNMARGFEIYQELFGNAQDFTFIVTGNFPADKVIPLFNKYLGNLSVIDDNPEVPEIIDAFASIPKGPMLVEFTVPETSNNANFKYRPLYLNEFREKLGWKDILVAEVLGQVLNDKVWNLRVKKGYSLYVVGAYSKFNEDENQLEFGASFDCVPEEYPLLRKEFAEIIESLKSSLISEEFLAEVVKRMKVVHGSKRAKRQSQMQNSLYKHYKYDLPWFEAHEAVSFIDTITTGNILEAARKYFTVDSLFEFVMKN